VDNGKRNRLNLPAANKVYVPLWGFGVIRSLCFKNIFDHGGQRWSRSPKLFSMVIHFGSYPHNVTCTNVSKHLNFMRVVLTILILLAWGCKDKKQRASKPALVFEDALEMKKLKERIDKVQTTPSGNFFKILRVDDKKFKIEWGTKEFSNTSIETFPFSLHIKLRFAWENEEFLILRNDFTVQGWIYYCFPLKKDSEEFYIENPLVFDVSRNLVVSDGFRYDTVLLINNISTGAVQPLIEKERCYSQLFHNCIDSIALTGDELYYRFQVALDKSDENENFERRVGVKI
jgi:hypothetical protein